MKMPPTAKAVLICLADHASDSGECWPSISTICDRTCFGRTAVIQAIKWLEDHSAVVADRSDRYRTTYRITPSKFKGELVREANQSVTRTSPHDGALVRLANNEVREANNEVREADTNRHEPSRTVIEATIKRKRAGAPSPDQPDDVEPQTWADWLALRKAKKAPVTETVLRNARAEAAKAGLPLTKFLEVWCARGSQGLQAEWLKPHERGPPAGRVPVNANFQGKTYEGDSDDELPSFLRRAS